ncbi:MAG: UDP-glucose--hexose-1-phosphate uridylyltransferase [Armatimonadetes bacterium]|nr:UDP-glucose--hexose-1-phosphate uridylyltransferase [Armatimonadota bacterium]
MSSKFDTPHRRKNLLTGEWVLVSPHRTKRPWLGRVETPTLIERPQYDPQCYLCPGNVRAEGAINPIYTEPYAFLNDFPALLKDESEISTESSPLLQSKPVRGECWVICFSPRHDLTLPEMEVSDIAAVVRTWQRMAQQLGEQYTWVQIFENKGDVMGCSNPHPHGQIWASDSVPSIVETENQAQRAFSSSTGRNLLESYRDQELEEKERVVCENEDWAWMVPFWATWPYEILLLPKFHVSRITELTEIQAQSLAEMLKLGLTLYDNLFETSFPYSMGWHGAPFGAATTDHWLLHAHFYPPLLRSSTVKKFMVGYEMLAEAQRDITPEQAADRLRSLPKDHYRTRIQP